VTPLLLSVVAFVLLPVCAALGTRARGWHRPWQLVLAAYLGAVLGGELLGVWMDKVWGPSYNESIRVATARGAEVAILSSGRQPQPSTLPSRLLAYLLVGVLAGFVVSMYHLWCMRHKPRQGSDPSAA